MTSNTLPAAPDTPEPDTDWTTVHWKPRFFAIWSGQALSLIGSALTQEEGREQAQNPSITHQRAHAGMLHRVWRRTEISEEWETGKTYLAFDAA